MNDVQQLVKQHEAGLSGLLHLYPKKLLWKGSIWPLIITTVLLVSFLIAGLHPHIIAATIVDATISIMPSLLGFLLGGYTILISFTNNKLLAMLTQSRENEAVSTFQKISCIFALTILVQSLSLAMALIAKFFMLALLNLNGHGVIVTLQVLGYLFCYALMFMLFYMTFSFKDIIVNIFSLTQLFHLNAVISPDEPDDRDMEPVMNDNNSSKPRRNGGAY